jgi:murein tripeptide amidase MpaA
MKKIILSVAVVLVLILVGYLYWQTSVFESMTPITTDDEVPTSATPTNGESMLEDEQVAMEEDETQTVIGTSVNGTPLVAYHYGTGDKEVLMVGGIHGGYSWNTALVAYELMDYLEANPATVPAGVKVTVIPVLNPDGLEAIVGTSGRFTASAVPTAVNATIPGRFNANTVDLNRNFDCEWQATGRWQNRDVSGGATVFSEPESQAVRAYVTSRDIAGAVVWYSAAGGVYSSSCRNGVSDDTRALTQAYAEASGYPAYQDFDYYEITGDMVNWFAKNNIPAISVLLTNHRDTEWSKNRAGIDAILEYIAR